MDRNWLFVTTLVLVCALFAYVANGMFGAGKMLTFEMSKMYFAAAVLAFLAFIFLLSIILYALGPEPRHESGESPGKSIFDACVKVIPPLVTLIIGFYFGVSQNNTEPESESTALVAPAEPETAE